MSTDSSGPASTDTADGAADTARSAVPDRTPATTTAASTDQPTTALSNDSAKSQLVEQEAAEQPETVKLAGQTVVFEQNTSPASSWPGGDFKAEIPGYAPQYGSSFEAALEKLTTVVDELQEPPAEDEE